MHTQLFFFTAVLTLVSRAFGYVYSTQGLCKTAYATKSTSSVKSTSIALTIPLTFTTKYTSTPTVTITPAPVSTAVTTTSTITTVISTVATTTIYTTTTSTSTVFTTSTQTIDGGTTTTTGTTTIPTPPGFTPVVSGYAYAPKKRSEPLAVKGRLAKRATTTTWLLLPIPSSPHSTCSPAIYPTAVTCAYLVEAITTTTKIIPATVTAKTTLAPSTKTSTSTAFTTVTSISTLASASTTITVSAAPTTTTSTVITSTTTTVTVIAPSATFYAACAAYNMVNSANGGNGIPYIMDGVSSPMTTSDKTAYDCCVSCQTGTDCIAYAFLNTCYYFPNPYLCAGSSQGLTAFASQQDYAPSDGYTIGDGPCGQITNAGNGPAGTFPDPPDPPGGVW